MSNYLYIFEDGDLAQSADPPTQTDIDCLMNGILTVIKVEGSAFYEMDFQQQWKPIRKAKFNETHGGYHEP